MYAIAVTPQVQADKIEKAASIFQNSLVPSYQQLNGFKHVYLFIDPATGENLGIWATEADRNAVQFGGALQEQLVRFAALLAAPPRPATM